jgi:hypothetical protein
VYEDGIERSPPKLTDHRWVDQAEEAVDPALSADVGQEDRAIAPEQGDVPPEGDAELGVVALVESLPAAVVDGQVDAGLGGQGPHQRREVLDRVREQRRDPQRALVGLGVGQGFFHGSGLS